MSPDKYDEKAQEIWEAWLNAGLVRSKDIARALREAAAEAFDYAVECVGGNHCCEDCPCGYWHREFEAKAAALRAQRQDGGKL